MGCEEAASTAADDDQIKNKLSIKFHSKLIYDKKYLKAKVRRFDGAIKTNLLGNDMYYTCIACTTIDSVMRMNKKNPSAGLFRGMQI